MNPNRNKKPARVSSSPRFAALHNSYRTHQALSHRTQKFEEVHFSEDDTPLNLLKTETYEPSLSSPEAAVQASPMSYLPSEILEIILEEAMPDTPPVIHPTSPPWSFSQVCRSWRAAVIGYSRLWSDAKISLTLDSMAHSAEQFELVEIWLSRSGIHPFSLCISAEPSFIRHHDPHFSSTQMIRAMMSILSGFMPRCRSLQMALPLDPDLIDALPTPLDGNFWSLQELQLASPNDPYGIDRSAYIPRKLEEIPTSCTFPNARFQMPYLHSLRAFEVVGLHKLFVPWAQLTELVVEECGSNSVASIITVLRWTPRLVDFRLVLPSGGPLDSNPAEGYPTSVELPYLEHFTFIEPWHFPAGFILPNLKTLEYEGPNWTTRRLSQLATHTLYLTTLIVNARADHAEWIDVLQKLEYLKVFAERPVPRPFGRTTHPPWRFDEHNSWRVQGTFGLFLFQTLTPSRSVGVKPFLPSLEELEGFAIWEELERSETWVAWLAFLKERQRLRYVMHWGSHELRSERRRIA